MNNNYNEISEAGYDASQEIFIVTLSYTIIKPHTVVVEIVNATIARATVFACGQAITIAELAEEHFAVIRSKNNFFIMARPFVVIDDAIGGIANCCEKTCNNEYYSQNDIQYQ
jgi:hypothetical protein